MPTGVAPSAQMDCVASGSPGRHSNTLAHVSPVRRCSRTACGRQAVATLTYVYADSTAVLGPLATYPEPHCYDLCSEHSERLTAPRGWQVVRLSPPETGRRTPSSASRSSAIDAWVS